MNQLQEFGNVKENVNLKNYNTFNVEGKAKYVVEPTTINNLKLLLEYLNENNLEYILLGFGSNVVLNEKKEFNIIVRLNNINGIEYHDNYVYAEAGASLAKVSLDCTEHSLRGLEFASGIPGTIGASIYNNAGAYNSCIMDYVESVTVLHNDDIEIIKNEDISYGYRTSLFKEKKEYIILAAKFRLEFGDKELSLNLIKDRKERRIAAQPLEYPSAGSVFRNPEGDHAGRLIEACGLKGYRIGGAQVSEKHANFIVNVDNATGNDIRDLILYIHDEVLRKTKVDMLIEQEFIGWE